MRSTSHDDLQNTDYYNPITNVNSTDMTCNRGPVPANETAWVKAGSTVGFVLDRAIFHDGPINVYMANAPSAETAYSFDGKGSVWFKIADLGPTIDGTTYVAHFRRTFSRLTECLQPNILAIGRLDFVQLHYPRARPQWRIPDSG